MSQEWLDSESWTTVALLNLKRVTQVFGWKNTQEFLRVFRRFTYKWLTQNVFAYDIACFPRIRALGMLRPPHCMSGCKTAWKALKTAKHVGVRKTSVFNAPYAVFRFWPYIGVNSVNV
jgi:hypothetical protein